jgi:hypothetical protein
MHQDEKKLYLMSTSSLDNIYYSNSTYSTSVFQKKMHAATISPSVNQEKNARRRKKWKKIYAYTASCTASPFFRSIFCSRHHPPRTAHNTSKHQSGEDARSRLVARGDGIELRGLGFGARACRRIALTGAARVLGEGTGDLVLEQVLDDLHGGHLLADTERAVVDAVGVPAETACRSVFACIALLGGGLGGGLQFGHEHGARDGRDFGCVAHPAGEVGLEGALVHVALAVFLARHFEHDVGGLCGEEDAGSFDDAEEVVFPCLVFGLEKVSVYLVAWAEDVHTALYMAAAPAMCTPALYVHWMWLTSVQFCFSSVPSK